MTGFRMPTRVHIAPGVLSHLPASCRQLSLDRVLLVVDPGLSRTEHPEAVGRLLREAGLHWVTFDEVEPNPRTSTAERIAEQIRAEKVDGVIGLGGGSVLDAAKAGAMLATNAGHVTSFEGKNRFAHQPLPMIAIPTTCGTGSEVTWVAVLTVESTQTKISIKGDGMFPAQALVDADLIRTLPAEMVAWTGVDALTHALEATTGQAANPVSDALAEKAITLLFSFLPRAVAAIAEDDQARHEVMRASTLAGLAFGNADVGAVHCLSETLGGLFDVPHGLANAVLLGPVLRYHRPFIASRLAELDGLLDRGGPLADVDEAADRFLEELEGLLEQLGVPAFSSFGISGENYTEIAERAVRNGSNAANPQPMSVHNYVEILEALG